MFRSNPTFSAKALENVAASSVPMTINGAIGKTLALLLFAFIGAALSVYGAVTGAITGDKVEPYIWVSAIGGFVLALVITFKPNLAKILAPVYAFAEGVFLGMITLLLEATYPGIAFKAIAVTMLSLFSMLMLYRFNILKATDRFRQTIMTALWAIVILYVINIIGHWVPFLRIPMVNDASPIGIAFSVIICVIASLCFIIDFDNIKMGAERFMPKDYEWYFAFGLMVTLVWLYVEVLRLLAKLNRR